LEDPKVCRIYEYARGADQDYLVLELVEGTTLQQILRAEPARLTHRRKLRIAEQLLDVLVRTHAEGIVHRDLKPSNLMLTAADELKVLDFGIALVDEMELAESVAERSEVAPIEAADQARTLLETRRGHVLGTAFYMSPEQARGERATPASDIYSLGLVLQELFTGIEPHPAGLSVEKLVARAILAKSESVAGLSLDLTRWIEGLKNPSARHRPTAAEARQALRHILDKPRRRRRLIVVSAAVLLLVGAGVVHTLRLRSERNAAIAARERAEQARLEADAARTEAQQVIDFLTSLFAVTDPSVAQGRTITADELLRRGAAKIANDLAEQPLVRARLENTIGTVYRELGLYEEAQHFLAEALAIRREKLSADDPAIAESLRALGLLHGLRGRFDEAEVALREVLARRSAGAAELEVAGSLHDLGELARQRGRWPEAEELFGRALAIYERHPQEQTGRAKTLSSLAGVFWRTARLDDAEPLMRRVLAIDEAILGPHHPRLARTLNNLGLIAQQHDRQGEAEALFRRALAIKEQSLGAEHPELASTIYNIGVCRQQLADLDGALALFGRALALDEKAHGSEHPNVAFTLIGLGTALRDRGRSAEAEAAYRRALAILDRALPGHPAREELLREWATLRRQKAAMASGGSSGS
jgi:eukaryotic-like serine/threonine-protein kinase